MGKHYDSVELNSLKAKQIPYNIIIALIAIACVISLYLGTFWQISVNYQVSESMMKTLLQSGDEFESNEATFFDNIDFEAIASQAKFEMSLSLSPAVLLTSLQNDNTKTVTAALNEASKEILSNVDIIIKNIFKAGAKLAVNMALNEVNNTIEDELSMQSANIDLTGMDEIVDEMLSENPDSVKIKADLLALTMTQIDNNTNLTEEQKTQLKLEASQSVGEFYDNIITEYGDDNGVINPSNIVMSVMGDSLGINIDGEMSPEDLSLAISQKLVASMSESTVNSISSVLKGFAIFLVVVMAAWALLALKAILRIFLKKKGVSFRLARFLGVLPYLLLVAIPMGIILLLPRIFANSSMTQYQEAYLSYTKGLTLTFKSTTYISLLGSVALTLVNLFGYKSLKKQIKKY